MDPGTRTRSRVQGDEVAHRVTKVQPHTRKTHLGKHSCPEPDSGLPVSKRWNCTGPDAFIGLEDESGVVSIQPFFLASGLVEYAAPNAWNLHPQARAMLFSRDGGIGSWCCRVS